MNTDPLYPNCIKSDEDSSPLMLQHLAMKGALTETLRREDSVLDPSDAEGLADVIIRGVRLIAAAPELLEALENVRNAMRDNPQTFTFFSVGSGEHGAMKLYKEIDNVIKKARGK